MNNSTAHLRHRRAVYNTSALTSMFRETNGREGSKKQDKGGGDGEMTASTALNYIGGR